jgi:hypothetical protein
LGLGFRTQINGRDNDAKPVHNPTRNNKVKNRAIPTSSFLYYNNDIINGITLLETDTAVNSK